MTRPTPTPPATDSATAVEIEGLRERWLASGRQAKAFDIGVKSSAHLAAIKGILRGVTGKPAPPPPPPPPPPPAILPPVVVRNTAAVEAALPYGPAMSKLPPMRQTFVLALLADDRDCGASAARAAGYSDNGESAKTTASRLRRDPDVLAAIHETAVAQLSSLKLLATATVREIMDDPQAKGSDRLKAAAMVFDRAGMPTQSEQHITVEHKMSEQELIADITRMAKQLDLDPRKLLGGAGVVIEGEFTEVPAGNTTGLEDVL